MACKKPATCWRSISRVSADDRAVGDWKSKMEDGEWKERRQGAEYQGTRTRGEEAESKKL
jgi:hypothetical protein